jgi:hypothetical protein
VDDAARGIRPIPRGGRGSAQRVHARDLIERNIIEARRRLPARIQVERLQLVVDTDAVNEQQRVLRRDDATGPAHVDSRPGSGHTARSHHRDARDAGRKRVGQRTPGD